MKKVTTFGWLLLAALALLLAGCALPPYDEDIALAAKTTPKLRLEHTIGPLYVWLDEWPDSTEFYFLPSRRDPVAGGGFFVIAADYGLRVHYLDAYAAGFGADWGAPLDDQPATANRLLLEPIKSSDSNHWLSLLRYCPTNDYRDSDLYLIQATDPTFINTPGVPIPNLTNLLASWGYPPSVAVGSSIYPLDSASPDRDIQFLLCRDLATGDFFELECETSTSNGMNLVAAGSYFNLPLLPDSLRNAFYHRNPLSGRSYLSYYSTSARAYRSYSWLTNAGDELKELTDIEDRIDALLTTGELLSFDSGACTVYSASGVKQFRFPLGGLRFCYERHDGAEYRLYFSQAYLYYGRNDKSDQLYLKVYSLPTADLDSLR